MVLFILVPAWIIALSLVSISGSLRRLADHHEKFPPPPADAL